MQSCWHWRLHYSYIHIPVCALCTRVQWNSFVSAVHLWLQILAMGKWSHVALENQRHVMCRVYTLVCSSAPSNGEVLSLIWKWHFHLDGLMGLIWYSEEFQQFLQDINRGLRSVNRSNFGLSATIAVAPWVMVMLVGGGLPQSRVGLKFVWKFLRWLKSWRTIHSNPEVSIWKDMPGQPL